MPSSEVAMNFVPDVEPDFAAVAADEPIVAAG